MFKKLKQMLCDHDYILGDIQRPPYGYCTKGDHFKCACSKCGKEVITFLTYEQQSRTEKGCHMKQ